MKNKTKLRKQMSKTGQQSGNDGGREAALAWLNAKIVEDNIREMDALADRLGIIRCSDFINQKRQEDKEAGLCTCGAKH